MDAEQLPVDEWKYNWVCLRDDHDMHAIVCDVMGIPRTSSHSPSSAERPRWFGMVRDTLRRIYPAITGFESVSYGQGTGYREYYVFFDTPAAAVEFKLRHGDYVQEIR